MRAEKTLISNEYVARLNVSPFFLVVDYKGLSVGRFTELRKRLTTVGGEVHVVKNSLFRIAVKEAGLPDVGASGLTGQLAVVTGKKDVSVAAKVLKNFRAEFDRPKVQFGYLNRQRLAAADILVLADLPSLDVLRGRLMGVLNAPATRLVGVLNAPGQQLARVLRAKADKG